MFRNFLSLIALSFIATSSLTAVRSDSSVFKEYKKNPRRVLCVLDRKIRKRETFAKPEINKKVTFAQPNELPSLENNSLPKPQMVGRFQQKDNDANPTLNLALLELANLLEQIDTNQESN